MKIPKKPGSFTWSRLRFYLATSVGLLILGISVIVFSYSSDLQAVSLFTAGSLMILFKANYRRWPRRFLRRKRVDPVAEALKSLADDYVVFSDIVLPDSKGSVDYLLIGSNGVFAIEIKNYSGSVKCEEDEWFVNGRRVRSLSKQAKRNSIAVRGCIAKVFSASPTGIPYIVPLLVFVSPTKRLKLFKPAVPVVRLGELVAFIRERETKQPITPEEKASMVQHLQLLQRNFAYLSDASATEAEPLDKAG
jgi:uncharacterized membrane protein